MEQEKPAFTINSSEKLESLIPIGNNTQHAKVKE